MFYCKTCLHEAAHCTNHDRNMFILMLTRRNVSINVVAALLKTALPFKSKIKIQNVQQQVLALFFFGLCAIIKKLCVLALVL